MQRRDPAISKGIDLKAEVDQRAHGRELVVRSQEFRQNLSEWRRHLNLNLNSSCFSIDVNNTTHVIRMELVKP